MRQLFRAVRGPVGEMELRAALKSPEGKRIAAMLAFSCVGQQRRALIYLFPDEKVDFHQEAQTGKTVEWLKKLH